MSVAISCGEKEPAAGASKDAKSGEEPQAKSRIAQDDG